MTQKDATDLFFRLIWTAVFVVSAVAMYQWFK
jgi:hypothetical protein